MFRSCSSDEISTASPRSVAKASLSSSSKDCTSSYAAAEFSCDARVCLLWSSCNAHESLPILSFKFSAFRIGEMRSEEHTSELQSLMRIPYAVFCLQQKTNKS